MRDGRETGSVFVEGLRLAEETLRADLEITDVLFTPVFAASERGRAFLEKAAARGIALSEVADKIFDSVSDTKQTQGIVLICRKPAHGKKAVDAALRNNKSGLPFFIMLHEINNPANLGAILRSAEAVGADAVITTKKSADVFSPKALRAAMGAALRLPVWTNADYAEVLAWARANDLKSVCADVRSEKSYTEIDWRQPKLLVVGSEARGLSEEERSQTDESLVIPMKNGVESLNAAVACSVILFEAKRRRES